MTKRYEYCVNDADCYRIADMTNCKTLEQFIEDVKKEHHEWYTEEEIKELAKDEYADYIYNHGLEGYEVIDKLNEQDKKINYLTELVETYREYTIPELRIMRRMLKENGLYQQFLDRVDSEVILKNEKLRNILEPYLSRSGDME